MSRPHKLQIIFMISGAFTLITILFYVWYRGKSPKITLQHDSVVQAIAFSSDGSTLASQGTNGSVKLWDVASGNLQATLPASGKPAWFQFKPRVNRGGTLLAEIAKTEGQFRHQEIVIIDTLTHKEKLSLVAHLDQVNDVAFSPNGDLLATGGGYTDHPWPVNAAGNAKLWDANTGRLLVTLTRHWGAVSAVAFSPDGQLLATASYDGTIKLWDVSYILGR